MICSYASPTIQTHPIIEYEMNALEKPSRQILSLGIRYLAIRNSSLVVTVEHRAIIVGQTPLNTYPSRMDSDIARPTSSRQPWNLQPFLLRISNVVRCHVPRDCVLSLKGRTSDRE